MPKVVDPTVVNSELARDLVAEEMPEKTPFPLIGRDLRRSVTADSPTTGNKIILDYLSPGHSASEDPRLCPWTLFQNMSARDKRAIALYWGR